MTSNESKVYSESEIADLMTRFGETVGNDPAPVQSTRRTRIVESVPGPESDFRVRATGYPAIDVSASTPAHAALQAIEAARMVGLAAYAGAIFMRDYIVVDSDGNVTRGNDEGMRDLIDARIERQQQARAARNS